MTAHLDDFGRAEWWTLAKLGVTVPHNEAAMYAVALRAVRNKQGSKA